MVMSSDVEWHDSVRDSHCSFRAMVSPSKLHGTYIQDTSHTADMLDVSEPFLATRMLQLACPRSTVEPVCLDSRLPLPHAGYLILDKILHLVR